MGWLSGGRGGGAENPIDDPKEERDDGEDIEQQRQLQQQQPLSPLEEERRNALGQGFYHLPGNPTEPNKWWKDYCQFFRNNHPLLAPCLQDKLHPISKPMRAVGLIGSLMVGLVITNVIFLWFLPNYGDSTSEGETNVAIFKLSTGGFAIQNGTSVTYYDSSQKDGSSSGEGQDGGIPPEVAAALSDQTTIEYYGSTELIILWTVGSLVHSLFDATIWYVTSCSCLTSLDSFLCCCFFDKDDDDSDHDENDDENTNDNKQSQRHRRHRRRQGPIGRWVNDHRGWCNVLVIMMVVLITAAATLVVMIRALDEATDGNGSESAQEVWNSVSTSGDSSTGVDAIIPMPTNLEGAEQVTEKENYRFLLTYAIEIGFAWFVWFPIVETILFSGVLSCRGRNPIPGLGGRPAELRAIRAAEEAEERKNKRASEKLRKAQKRLSSKTESNPTSSMIKSGQTSPTSNSTKRKSKTTNKNPTRASKSKTNGQRRQSNSNSSSKKNKKSGR
eukprot:CAMPEP_0113494630 /NCGR_PEP_ID=MMETSP0014_2-20120614/29202_1 /TAXON_ID=2857 /ORGANISM="Nitzschia sp." /LENGTH=500 /DNA_ID=CAMNT_0000388521 /DNA_START=106 /DNA_END=1608 /DNA_ORIENTATION=- /assembly_acc=CAM_ASM_000159